MCPGLALAAVAVTLRRRPICRGEGDPELAETLRRDTEGEWAASVNLPKPLRLGWITLNVPLWLDIIGVPTSIQLVLRGHAMAKKLKAPRVVNVRRDDSPADAVSANSVVHVVTPTSERIIQETSVKRRKAMQVLANR